LSYQLVTDYFSEMIDLMNLDSVYALGCSDGAIVSMLLAHDRPQKVKRIIGQRLKAGTHTYQFNGKNLASGIFYYQLVVGEYNEVKKMILLR